MELEIDGERLYRDLQDHFGTARVGILGFTWLSAALGELEAAYEQGDWDTIVRLAQEEGFNLWNYKI